MAGNYGGGGSQNTYNPAAAYQAQYGSQQPQVSWQMDPRFDGRGTGYTLQPGEGVTANGTPYSQVPAGSPEGGTVGENAMILAGDIGRQLGGDTQRSDIRPGAMSSPQTWEYYNFPRYQEQDLALQAQQWGTTGTGPSAAQAMLNRQRSANTSQARSMAASQAGVNPAIAYRQMSDQAAQANQAADTDAAALRAQEQQAMLAQAANLWGQQRQADQTQFGTSAQGDIARLNAETQINRDEAERAAGTIWGRVGSIIPGYGG